MMRLADLVKAGERRDKQRVAVELFGRDLVLSNLGKVMYPADGFTKGDVIDYYLQIAPTMLTHLAHRPVTRKRYPNGVDQSFFFEKNKPQHKPDWVETVRIEAKDRPVDYIVCSDTATLVWLANSAALELHTNIGSDQHPERPQYVVFDLDPGPGTSVVECCRLALQLRDTFRRLGLVTVAKTSGSKGLQLYIPLNDPRARYDRTRAFAKAVAEMWEREAPELVVSKMTKTLRDGKVLIDWSQNNQVKTTVCAYSLRAREHPTVSTPVTWREVSACDRSGDPDSLRFTSARVLERTRRRGDLFAEAATLRQSLPELS
jgi:bifunctional non-homologous end joining protein LigD